MTHTETKKAILEQFKKFEDVISTLAIIETTTPFDAIDNLGEYPDGVYCDYTDSHFSTREDAIDCFLESGEAHNHFEAAIKGSIDFAPSPYIENYHNAYTEDVHPTFFIDLELFKEFLNENKEIFKQDDNFSDFETIINDYFKELEALEAGTPTTTKEKRKTVKI